MSQIYAIRQAIAKGIVAFYQKCEWGPGANVVRDERRAQLGAGRSVGGAGAARAQAAAAWLRRGPRVAHKEGLGESAGEAANRGAAEHRCGLQPHLGRQPQASLRLGALWSLAEEQERAGQRTAAAPWFGVRERLVQRRAPACGCCWGGVQRAPTAPLPPLPARLLSSSP